MRAKHIVVVDDDADVLDAIEGLLGNAGYRVTGFPSATAMRAAAPRAAAQ
jgi:FixJ family two-component response regulator